MKKIIKLIFMLWIFSGCSRDFLEEKSDQKLLIPNTLEDFQLLLDNNAILNKTTGLVQIASDDFYVTESGFDNLDEANKKAYLWQLNENNALTNADWKAMYEAIFYCNVVLDGLQNFEDESQESKFIKGQALFFRTYAIFCLMQEFAPVYSRETLHMLSIPIPLKSDIKADKPRLTVEKIYDLMVNDLKAAEQLLPSTQTIKTRPSALAALSLLGRMHLLMGEYVEAELYLAQANVIYNRLINYNTLSVNSTRPFPTDFPTGPGNDEIIFYSPFINYSFLGYSNTQVRVDSKLVENYAADDLRKGLYFQNRGNNIYTYKGSYSGSKISTLFAGLSTDENYLNYAEALVRNGKIGSALNIVNQLLKTRFKTGKYIDFQSTNKDEVLNYILVERQKSLIGKGARWWDIRRFNTDPQYLIKATRILKEQKYELSLNDKRLQFSIPIDEMIE